ncbi:unnamed protein product [Camellia sinensis]
MQNKQILIDAVVHAVNEDYVEMANDFTRLGFLASGTDVSPIIPALEASGRTVLVKDSLILISEVLQENVAKMSSNPALKVNNTQMSRDWQVDRKLDLTDTIKDGARLFLVDKGIRRQLLLALTEDSKLHIQELVDVYRLVEDQIDIPSVALEVAQEKEALLMKTEGQMHCLHRPEPSRPLHCLDRPEAERASDQTSTNKSATSHTATTLHNDRTSKTYEIQPLTCFKSAISFNLPSL